MSGFRYGRRTYAARLCLQRKINAAEKRFRELAEGDMSAAELENCLANEYMRRAALAANLLCIVQRRKAVPERFKEMAMHYLKRGPSWDSDITRKLQDVVRFVVRFVEGQAEWRSAHSAERQDK